MGGNGSKQTDEKKGSQSNPDYEPAYELNHRSSLNRQNRLRSPHDNRPIELSWLQQNQHHHHHHQHHEEHNRRIPIAINRWPKDDKQPANEKPKSFIEEYIHQ